MMHVTVAYYESVNTATSLMVASTRIHPCPTPSRAFVIVIDLGSKGAGVNLVSAQFDYKHTTLACLVSRVRGPSRVLGYNIRTGGDTGGGVYFQLALLGYPSEIMGSPFQQVPRTLVKRESAL